MASPGPCPRCDAPLDEHAWCHACGRGQRLRAHEWAQTLLDADADEVLMGVHSGDPLDWPGYAEARNRAPGEESVRVWRGAVTGRGCILVVYDFAHLGGSQGAGAGTKVARAFALAAADRLPVVTVTATGGSRMQEGMVALAQMPRSLVAARAHARRGLLQITVASDPTTGGVYASFAGQADLVVAEPGAYVAFAGPRVATSLGGGEMGQDVNTAEFAHEHGLIDAVVARPDLRAWLGCALAAVEPGTAGPGTAGPGTAGPDTAGPDTAGPDTAGPDTAGQRRKSDRQRSAPRPPASAWARVQAARDPARPRASAIVERLDHVTALHGDRCGGHDEGVVVCLARLDARPVAVVGLQRTRVQPAGYRTAWRVFDLAARLTLPVVTLVDTPGADPGAPAEAAGQAHAIGTTIARMLALPVPTVAVVIGEGGSGGAMALAVADRLLIQRIAIFSVIAPEGAAAILHRDPARAPEVAELLKPDAEQLVALDIADAVIGDAVEDVLAAVARELDALCPLDAAERVAARERKWGEIGAAFTEAAGA